MNKQEAIAKMIAPGTKRPGKYRQGVIQIWITRHCDKACFGCTQGSNLRHQPSTPGIQQFITLNQFEQAVLSLKGYFGVVGVFGGNPAIHPQFKELCEILTKHIPYEQRGLWCNNPLGKGSIMRKTFNPAVSNINVHLDKQAYDEFRRDWPECHPVGLTEDSRHSPPYVAMKDVITKDCPSCEGTGDGPSGSECPQCLGKGDIVDSAKIWELVANCPINKHWSAMLGIFRGQLRAWFCEIAGAQAMLHQHEPEYPDTGIKIGIDGMPTGEMKIAVAGLPWWQWDMPYFTNQVKKHCFDCGVPLQGFGELAQSNEGIEQVSVTHEGIYQPKKKDRSVQIVNDLIQLDIGKIQNMTKYLQNSKLKEQK